MTNPVKPIFGVANTFWCANLITFGWMTVDFLIWPTFNTTVHSPGRSFEEKACGKGDFSDNLDAAAPSC